MPDNGSNYTITNNSPIIGSNIGPSGTVINNTYQLPLFSSSANSDRGEISTKLMTQFRALLAKSLSKPDLRDIADTFGEQVVGQVGYYEREVGDVAIDEGISKLTHIVWSQRGLGKLAALIAQKRPDLKNDLVALGIIAEKPTQ